MPLIETRAAYGDRRVAVEWADDKRSCAIYTDAGDRIDVLYQMSRNGKRFWMSVADDDDVHKSVDHMIANSVKRHFGSQ